MPLADIPFLWNRLLDLIRESSKLAYEYESTLHNTRGPRGSAFELQWNLVNRKNLQLGTSSESGPTLLA
jgi:hypothetical protein